MNCNAGEYINNLAAQSGVSQADIARGINVSRQLLSYVISGKREMSLQLAMKLESFFSLPEGELMKMQAMQAVLHRKKSIREHLCRQLVAKNAFWSFEVKSFDDIPDEELIEKCFTVLDIKDIDLMFELFSRKKILQVWKERMAETSVTQIILAERMGCTQQHISMLLRGRSNLTLETISKFEDALDFNIIGNLSPYTNTYLNEPEENEYGKNL